MQLEYRETHLSNDVYCVMDNDDDVTTWTLDFDSEVPKPAGANGWEDWTADANERETNLAEQIEQEIKPLTDKLPSGWVGRLVHRDYHEDGAAGCWSTYVYEIDVPTPNDVPELITL